MAKKYYCPYVIPCPDKGAACGDCPMVGKGEGNRSPRIVPTWGSRALTAGVQALVIGKAPDSVDDRVGKCFSGQVGKELRDGLEYAGIDPERCVYTYAVWCRDPKGAEPGKTLVNACAGMHLIPEVLCSAYLRPQVIIACGNAPLQALYPKANHKITKVMNRALEPPILLAAPYLLPPVVPVVSPAFVLRNEAAHRQTFRDGLVVAASIVNGTAVNVKPQFVPDEVFIATAQEDYAGAVERLTELASHPRPFVSFDVETSGLNPYSPTRKPRILTASVSVTDKTAVVVGFGHPEVTLTQEQKDHLSLLLREVLTGAGTVKVAHNMKFDMKWIKKVLGWEVTSPEFIGSWPGLFDTMLAYGVAYPGEPCGLDDLTLKLAGQYGNYWDVIHTKAKVCEKDIRKAAKTAMTTEDKFNAKENRYDFSLVPVRELAYYNAMDTMVTMHLLQKITTMLCERDVWSPFVNVTMPSSRAAADIEDNGMIIDEDCLLELVGETAFALESARERLMSMPTVVEFVRVMGEFKYTSNPQKVELLFGRGQPVTHTYGLLPVKTTESGAPSCDRKGLIEIMRGLDKDGEAWQALDALLSLTEEEKVLNTYLKSARMHVGSDGRVHCTYNVGGARSGRWSSSRPNLQNQPPHVRKMYKSRFENGYMLSADYSALESRIIACYCKDPTMLDIFIRRRDPHIINAGLMLGKDPGKAIKDGPDKDWGEVTQADRDKAKGAVSFGLAYGRCEKSLAKDLGIPIEEAAEMRAAFFASVPYYVKWMDDVKTFARNTGYVTTMFGRRRDVPDVWSSDAGKREAAYRIAINTPIQGTGADMTACSVVKINKKLKEEGYKSCIVATVHDSIVVDTHPDEVEAVANLLVATMEDVSDYPWAIIPFDVELKIERRWDESAKRRKKR